MYIYLNKLRKAFPFMTINFNISTYCIDVIINYHDEGKIYYHKDNDSWRLTNIGYYSSFTNFLNKFIEGLIKYKVY